MLINSVVVIEDPREKISAVIEDKLAVAKYNIGHPLPNAASQPSEAAPRLMLVSPMRASSESLLQDGPRRCGVLAAPGSSASLLSRSINAERVVSYGMSARDAVTLSSVIGDKSILSLQREITTLTGNILERQEFPVKFQTFLPAETLMAASTALLLMDFPPELMG